MPREAEPPRGAVGRMSASGSWWAALGFVLAAAAGMQWWTQSRLGPVNDELANLPAGVALLRTGEQADATHPPLARYLMALPLLAVGVDPHGDDPALGSDWHAYGRAFLFRNRLPWRTILDLARLPILLLCSLLTLGVALEARRRWGHAAGLAAAATVAFEPSILGHGTLATTDIALTLAVFATVVACEGFLRAPSGPRLLGVAALVTVATLTKFAGVLLVPILVTAALVRRQVRGRTPAGAPQVRGRWGFAAIGLSLLMIWGAYGFEVRSMDEDPQIRTMREAPAVREAVGAIGARVGMTADEVMALPIPAYSFLKGLGAQMFHAARQDAWEDKDFYQYLNGRYERSGFASYYLFTFLYKSTLPSLILWALASGAGAWALVRRYRRRIGTREGPGTAAAMAASIAGGKGRAGVAPGTRVTAGTPGPGEGPSWPLLTLAPVLWVAACSAQTINIGHRYVLPAIPFLCLAVGWLAGRLWQRALAVARTPGSPVFARSRAAAPAAAVIALVAAHGTVALAAAPDHIAFFNAIAGGTANGGRHLADSNLDWGQDLPALDTDVRTHCADGHRCIAAVFGTARPEDYGTPVEGWVEPMDPSILQEPTTLYVSENRYLLRSIAHPEGLFPFLRDRTPARRIGASIRVYEFP